MKLNRFSHWSFSLFAVQSHWSVMEWGLQKTLSIPLPVGRLHWVRRDRLQQPLHRIVSSSFAFQGGTTNIMIMILVKAQSTNLKLDINLVSRSSSKTLYQQQWRDCCKVEVCRSLAVARKDCAELCQSHHTTRNCPRLHRYLVDVSHHCATQH